MRPILSSSIYSVPTKCGRIANAESIEVETGEESCFFLSQPVASRAMVIKKRGDIVNRATFKDDFLQLKVIWSSIGAFNYELSLHCGFSFFTFNF